MVLDSPLFSVFDGSELLGLGAALPGAVPGGVFVIGLMLLDELDGVDDDDGLIVDDDDGVLDVLPELMPPDVDGDGEVDDVDGLGIVVVSVVGVAGGSLFLQAPSAAKVAATATHVIGRRIELRMFTPKGSVRNPRVRAPRLLVRRPSTERSVGAIRRLASFSSCVIRRRGIL